MPGAIWTLGTCGQPLPRVWNILMKIVGMLLVVVSLVPAANVTGSQIRPMFTKRLRSPAAVRGFIGGESHDRYVIHVRRGRVLTVRLSWRREGDNRAEFGVTQSPDRESVEFGSLSNDGKCWTGNIPNSGDYYIYVVAHPTAHYTLRVREMSIREATQLAPKACSQP